jgi:hypothetical protein
MNEHWFNGVTQKAFLYQKSRGRMIVRWYRDTNGDVIIFGVY